MIKLKKVLFLFIFFLAFFSFGASAEETPTANPVDLYFFEGQGCPHCAKMKSYLEGLKSDHPNLKVYDFEVYYNEENQALYGKMATAYGATSTGVPMIFIGDEYISGADFEKVKNAVEKCSSGAICLSPMDRISKSSGENNNQTPDFKNYETIGWIVLGVIVVGIAIVIVVARRKKNV
jgi:glutaredoxin